MISSRIGHSLDPLLVGIYRLLFGRRVVSPNVLTVFGLFFSLLASALAASSWPLFLAGIFLLVSGFFDLLDGAVARSAKMTTPFGGFLDSVLDRYSDLLVMLGIAIHFLRGRTPGPAFRDDLLLCRNRDGHHPLREGAGRGRVDRVQERPPRKVGEDHPARRGSLLQYPAARCRYPCGLYAPDRDSAGDLDEKGGGEESGGRRGRERVLAGKVVYLFDEYLPWQAPWGCPSS